MKHIIMIILILSSVALSLSLSARTRTTQSHLKAESTPVQIIPDTTADSTTTGLSQYDISIKGYSKRASDRKESFFVTNNTSHRISHVRLMFKYTSMQGEPLHTQEHSVEINLNPGETRLVSVTSWDTQRMFYYHSGPRPRKEAMPFQVAYRLLGYDIPGGK